MRRPVISSLLQFPHLIRFRLTMWYTGLAAVVLAAFVASVFYAFNQAQFQSYIDLMQQIVNQQAHVGLPPSPGMRGITRGGDYLYPSYFGLTFADPSAPDKGGNPPMVFYDAKTGQPLSKPPTDTVLSSTPAKADKENVANKGTPVQRDYKGYHFITIPLWKEGQRVIAQIAVPVNHIQQQLDDLKHILVYVAGVLLLLSAVGGWLLAGRALKPIDDITERAQQITINDLSQRLHLEQGDELGRMAATFDDLIERLQEAFERQKRFTSDASHELRTPLTVMQADLGLALARPRSGEEYRQTLVSMDEEVARLSTIVNNLLTLTRIDVDPAGMRHEPVNLGELLDGLVKRVRIVAAERNITVPAADLAAVTVTGDATRLRQLFTNLLDNAVNYTPAGGRVEVRLERTRDGAGIAISDTGIGIAPEHQKDIFERFYRTEEAREQNAHGTGLGLAISRTIVQAHRGEIAVQSTPGEGSTFTVLLPTDGRRRIRRFSVRPSFLTGAASAR